MTDALACYGRLGPQATGNPRVAELLQRTVEGQHRATVAFRATLDSLATRNLVPWTGPIGELTLLHNQWVTLLAWERATVCLDAAVTMNPTLSDPMYALLDKLCDDAGALSLRAIQMQTDVEQGRRPGNASLATIPPMSGNQSNVTAVWAGLEAIFMRVRADLALIARLGIPPRMRKVHRALLDAFAPQAKQFEYLLSQWRGTSSVENQVQLVRQALPLAQHFYTVGQQIWAPYLAGSVYIDIVRSVPWFAALKLPFDPWILTDPAEVDKRVTLRPSCEQLIAFWQTVADPLAAKALQDEINEALIAEDIKIESGRAFQIAPWQPYYRVHHAITLGLHELEAGALFTLYPRSVAGKRSLEIRVSR